MKYKWLLFDADGTLFDYDKGEALALAQTFQSLHFDYQPAYREIYRRINHDLWLEFEHGTVSSAGLRVKRFERLFAEIAISADPQSFSDQYLRHLGNAAELMDGAFDLVQSCRARYRLGLITNGLQVVQRSRLARSTLKDCFNAFVISDEVGVAKPDPAIFDIMFGQMGHPAREHVLIIGDSLTSDIQGGNNYGIDTCWFNPSAAPRSPGVQITYEIGHLSELKRILKPLESGRTEERNDR